MNFSEWSALVQDATRTALREISASHKLRLEGDEEIKKSDEIIARLYKDIDEAIKRRVIAQKLAKNKLVDERNKVAEPNAKKWPQRKTPTKTSINSTIFPDTF